MAILNGTALADTLTGGTTDDELFGLDGTDSLIGGDGADYLDGGDGRDTMAGGNGNDYFVVRQATDVVREFLDGGTDTVGSFQTYTLGNHVEHLELLGSTRIDGTGNGLANRITGNNAGNILSGLLGNDSLHGGSGADNLSGGDGNDLLLGHDMAAGGGITLTQKAQGYLTRGNTLVNNLGGTSGFGENELFVNDDGSSSAIDITSIFGEAGLNFFGTNYTSMFVNNNGNITFDFGLSTFTPSDIRTGDLAMIAPFWADVDTRGTQGNTSAGGNSTGTNRVYWDLDAVNDVVTITWNDVGYFSQHSDKVNAFQLQLINEGNGNFDIIFRYENIDWTTGDASGGSGGVGGTVARAGYSAGDLTNYVELTQSGNQSAILNLDTTIGNTGRVGTYVFQVRNGEVISLDDGAADTLNGGAGADILRGGRGNDQLGGGAGADKFVFAEAGNANADVIADFTPGSDKIQLDNAFFAVGANGALASSKFFKSSSATAAHDDTDRIIYNTTTGNLYYDSDGLGGAAAQLIATLNGSPNGVLLSDFQVI